MLPISDIGFAQRQLTGQPLEGGYQTPQEIADQVRPARTNVAPQPSALRQQELNKLLGID